MGAHPAPHGAWFTVWAPNARNVGVIGSFNNWQCQPLQRLDDGSGRWSGFVEGARDVVGLGDLVAAAGCRHESMVPPRLEVVHRCARCHDSSVVVAS